MTTAPSLKTNESAVRLFSSEEPISATELISVMNDNPRGEDMGKLVGGVRHLRKEWNIFEDPSIHAPTH